jgi:transposase-like protein
VNILYRKLYEREVMAAVALKCPFCGREDARSYGTANGKKRYACNNPACSHKTFYAEYGCNGCKPEVKKAIIKRAADGAGIRAAARELGISTDTVIKELKKRRTDRVCEQKLSGIP